MKKYLLVLLSSIVGGIVSVYMYEKLKDFVTNKDHKIFVL